MTIPDNQQQQQKSQLMKTNETGEGKKEHVLGHTCCKSVFGWYGKPVKVRTSRPDQVNNWEVLTFREKSKESNTVFCSDRLGNLQVYPLSCLSVTFKQPNHMQGLLSLCGAVIGPSRRRPTQGRSYVKASSKRELQLCGQNRK